MTFNPLWKRAVKFFEWHRPLLIDISSWSYCMRRADSTSIFLSRLLLKSYFFKSVKWKREYRISSYSFRGNYSFLNLTLCTVTLLWPKVRKLFKGWNYSRTETICGNTVLEKSGTESSNCLNSRFYA